jgi:hypothetical protein
MARKQIASLLVVLVWVATFMPFGSSVFNPTESDVQELGGERSTASAPEEPAPRADDES